MAPGFRQNRGPIPENRTLIRILGGTPHYNTGEERDQFHRNDDNVLLYPFESDRRIVAFKNRTWSRPSSILICLNPLLPDRSHS